MADEQIAQTKRKRARLTAEKLRWLKQAVSYGTARRIARVRGIPKEAWDRARMADAGGGDSAA